MPDLPGRGGLLVDTLADLDPSVPYPGEAWRSRVWDSHQVVLLSPESLTSDLGSTLTSGCSLLCSFVSLPG